MYELMFILLLSLATATCTLLLPFPPSTRRTLVRAIDQSSLTAACQGYIKFIPAAALSAWVYTLLEVTRAQSRLDSAADGASVRHESALHRAQRDALSCGVCALLLFVVHKLFVLLREVNQLTATKEALAKQAEGASAAYKAACEERDAAQKAGAGNAAEAKAAAAEEAAKSKTEAEDELERASETIKTLRDRNTALLAERDTAAKDVEALKKQAKGLSDEYGRLLMQKESLENKLSDYELVFGEGGDMKKAK